MAHRLLKNSGMGDYLDPEEVDRRVDDIMGREYQVYVDNVGKVYDGPDLAEATSVYEDYVRQGTHESVVLMQDGRQLSLFRLDLSEPIQEHIKEPDYSFTEKDKQDLREMGVIAKHRLLACIPEEYCPQCGSDADGCKCSNKSRLLSGKTIGDSPEQSSRLLRSASRVKKADFTQTYIPLQIAVLCQDCDCISGGNQTCPACGSQALMSVDRVMNRHLAGTTERKIAVIIPDWKNNEEDVNYCTECKEPNDPEDRFCIKCKSPMLKRKREEKKGPLTQSKLLMNRWEDQETPVEERYPITEEDQALLKGEHIVASDLLKKSTFKAPWQVEEEEEDKPEGEFIEKEASGTDHIVISGKPGEWRVYHQASNLSSDELIDVKKVSAEEMKSIYAAQHPFSLVSVKTADWDRWQFKIEPLQSGEGFVIKQDGKSIGYGGKTIEEAQQTVKEMQEEEAVCSQCSKETTECPHCGKFNCSNCSGGDCSGCGEPLVDEKRIDPMEEYGLWKHGQ
jgi:hypothetical protein